LRYDDTAPTQTQTLSLHDALPISTSRPTGFCSSSWKRTATWRLPTPTAVSANRQGFVTDEPNHPHRRQRVFAARGRGQRQRDGRSEEHTSELQSRENLVCRLLLEK